MDAILKLISEKKRQQHFSEENDPYNTKKTQFYIMTVTFSLNKWKHKHAVDPFVSP